MGYHDDCGKQQYHSRHPKQNASQLFKPRVTPENAGEDLKDNGEPQRDLKGQEHPTITPVLLRGHGCLVVQDEKRPFLDDLEQRIGEEHGKLAPQATPDHDDGDDDLKGVGCDPQVVPQE